MISAPLSSATFMAPSVSNYKNSLSLIANSAAKLSSGNRLTRASDDIAALAISTRMKSQIVALKQAQSNATQGSSMLQVAYNAITGMKDMLDRMTALATQANSGALTAATRSELQVELASLSDEIDRVTTNTSFNNIKLLDGSIGGNNLLSTTTTNATQATGSLVFSAISTGNTVKLNNVTLTADTEFAVGGSLQATIDNLVTYLNTSTNTALSGATYARSGSNTLTITQDAGGALGNQYKIDQATSTATFTTSGGSTAAANVYTLSGGTGAGLGYQSVKVSGTIGDSLVNTQAQTQASTTLTFSGNASNTETLLVDDGNGSSVTFTYVAASASSTQITIGSSVEETIENTIKMLSQYSGASDYGVRQLEFERSGNTLTIRNKNTGNANDLSGSALDISETISNASLSGASFNNGANTGVNVSAVQNKDFIGTISGFTATYNSADNITASLTVGSHTYSATISDTTPVSASFARFHSTSGGYFDVQIAAGGLAVANQTAADTFAARLDAAFAGLEFTQEREISSFDGTGSLAGASARITREDYTTTLPKLRDVVVSTTGTAATIDLDINGKTFRSGTIGTSLGAYETVRFTNVDNSAESVELTLGATSVSLTNSTQADAFETALRNSFGLTGTGGGTTFQVGESADDLITVRIADTASNKLFGGSTVDISTEAGAEAALTVLETAANSLGEILADVGTYQSRFDIASSILDTTISGVDQARSALADTDIASESTKFAQATVQSNAAIAVIAQTGKLQSELLKVFG